MSYENCCVVCGSCILQKNSKLTEMNVSPKEFTPNPRTNPKCAVRVLRHSRLGKLHRRIYNKLNCILITSKIACYRWKKGSHVPVTCSCILPMEQPLSWTTDYTVFYFETNGLTPLLLSLSPPSPHPLYHSANNTVNSSPLQSFSLKIRRYHHWILLNTTENPGQTNHSRSIKRKIKVFKCKGV